MKNKSLLSLLGCSNVLGYNLQAENNTFRMDFSPKNSHQEIFKKKIGISNLLILIFLFLFTNFLFAQQPACNLKGILESKKSNDGGQIFSITPDLHNAISTTLYRWEFISNTAGATFISRSNLPYVKIKPGNLDGEVNIKLTIINPGTASGGGGNKTCFCTKSISIGNL